MDKTSRNLHESIEYPKEGVLSKVIVKTDSLNITLFCMAKGTEISEHTSTKEGTVHVLEGEGVFVLSGEEIPMLPGILIHMEPNAIHALRAVQNTTFLLTLIG